MKKIISFFVLAASCAAMFCASGKSGAAQKNSPFESLEFFGSASMYFPENFEGDFWADSKYVFAYGAKLRLSAFEFRYFNSCGKTSGEDLWKINSADDYYDVFEKSRKSLKINLQEFEKNLDAEIALGSLGISSRMKNPPLSTVLSPFVSTLSDAASFSPSLPTKTSAKKDDSFFARMTFHSIEKLSNETIRFLPAHVEFVCTKNEIDGEKIPYLWTLRSGFLYKNFLKVTSGFWFERYYAQSSSVADVVWWSEIPVWNSALFNSFMNETTIAIPFFKNKFIFGITENFESQGRFWFRDEAVFRAGSFAFAFGAFASDNISLKQSIPLVASGGAKKYSLWQIKFVPEICVFLPKRATLKFGAGGFLESRIENYEKKNQFESLDAKFSTGAKFSGKTNSAKLTFSVSEIKLRQNLKEGENAELPKISATANYSHKFKNKKRVSSSASFSAKLSRDETKKEFSESVRVYYYPGISFLKSVSVGASASQKKSYGKKFAPFAKASFSFNLKKIKINADVCLNSNFKIP